MKLEIKRVVRCQDGSYGYFLPVSRNRSLISISTEMNKSVPEFAATLLHELLHFWVFLLRVEGAKLNKKEEHRFVYAAEFDVTKQMKKYFKEKTK